MAAEKHISKGKMISTAEAAGMLGIARSTLSTWVQSGRTPIPFYRMGSVYRFNTADIESYLDSVYIPAGV